MTIPFSELSRFTDPWVVSHFIAAAVNKLRLAVGPSHRTRIQIHRLPEGRAIKISVFEHRQTELAKLARSILNARGEHAIGTVAIFGDVYRPKRWKFDDGRWSWCVEIPGEGTILSDRVFGWW